MTRALYLDSTDQRTFEATVERVADDRVVLDRTCFYPTGGGQPHDTGTLTDGETTWTVSDVRKKDTIYHTVDGTPPEPGTTVTGELDWERRYDHMRYHTAQHLLSALLLEEYGAQTTGNQLYTDRARLDCAHPRFTDEDFETIDARMNELIDAELPVTWYTMDRETAEAELDPERTRIHLLPESITEIRIVEIGDESRSTDASSGKVSRAPGGGHYDRTACAGTHVENTGEIGVFRPTGRETKGSDEERLKFTLAEDR